MRTGLIGLLLAVAAATCLAMILSQARQAPETYPYADTATTSIYTLHAINGDLGTGAYSRFGWHHPGPLLYQVLAPLYALSGRREASLKWTMLLVNVSVLAVLLTYLGRHAPWLSATTALALWPLIYFEQRLLFWAWNPVAPLLSVVLAMALSAGVSAGHITALPWLAAILCFLVQSHLGLAPVAVLLGAISFVPVVRQLRSPLQDARGAAARVLVTSGLVAAVLWAVPVIRDVRAAESNLASVARFVVAGQPSQTWAQAADIVASQLFATFDPSRDLITGDMPPAPSNGMRVAAVVEVLSLGVGALWLRRRHRRFEATFSGVCLLASALSLLAVRRIEGDLFGHLVAWISVIGAVNIGALLSTILLMLPRQPAPWGRGQPLRTVVIVLWVGSIAVLGARRLEWKQDADARDRTLLHIASAIGEYCDDRGYVRPLLRYESRVWDAAAGVVLQLYKADRAVAVDDDVLYMFGERFARSGKEEVELYLMASDRDTLPAGVNTFDWIATVGAYRLIRVYRN